MVWTAKGPEYKIKTSSLEYDEIKNYYKDEDDVYKTIYLHETMENVKANLSERFICVYMYSRNIHNNNNVFEQFISTFNTVQIITKCNKSNILEFQFKTLEKNIIIFCCDPSNDINVISFKEVKELCIQNKVEWKKQSYTGFITSSKNNFFDELRGRIKFTKEQRNEFNKEFNFKCNVCKRCTKEKPFEIDHILP